MCFRSGTLTEVENEENNSTYPITINGNLPDNNYGFFMMDASGNKSPEAVKVTFDSVDEYGFPTDESSHIEGYLLTVPNGSVGTYVRKAGSDPHVIKPNATLNGSDHYLCPSLHATPHQRLLLWQFQFAV